MADIFNGIQKYVKTGNDWKLGLQFYIPGYDGPKTGILTNAASTRVRAGCFGLAVDFSGSYPISLCHHHRIGRLQSGQRQFQPPHST